MGDLIDLLGRSLDPEFLLQNGGLALLLLIVFAETGLFFGFFLPGDSLLFTAGLLCGTRSEYLDATIGVLLLTLCLAGTLGYLTGYWIGRKAGEVLLRRKDSLLFKKQYIDATRAFYDRHGNLAFILGRFLPIVRTFVPILAGMIRVDFRSFMFFNVIGCVAWVFSVVLAGYYLGMKFPGLKDYLEFIVLGMVLITAIPVVLTFLKERRRAQAASKE
ncbi:MAG: VTT domain-containing protein [Ferruginibacter sp.]|nr:VTT domain-containing protein [Cytophagales bacterium]